MGMRSPAAAVGMGTAGDGSVAPAGAPALGWEGRRWKSGEPWLGSRELAGARSSWAGWQEHRDGAGGSRRCPNPSLRVPGAAAPRDAEGRPGQSSLGRRCRDK